MKRLLCAVAAFIAVGASGTAAARVDVDIFVGEPRSIYRDYYYPPVRYVERPRVIVVPERHYRSVRTYGPRYYRDAHGPRSYHKNHKHHHRRMRHHHSHR
jgi:hypothetical protein